MNMDGEYPNRVAGRAFQGTRTFIDVSCDNAKHANVIVSSLKILLEDSIKSDDLVSTWSTAYPPSAVLARLQEVGFSVVAANTVGVTTVWTLQGNPNVRS